MQFETSDKRDLSFDGLKLDSDLTRTILRVISSDIFKLSPLKSLTNDQPFAVEGLVRRIFDDVRSDNRGADQTDIPIEALERLVVDAKAAAHHQPVLSQMRVRAGSDYVGHLRWTDDDLL